MNVYFNSESEGKREPCELLSGLAVRVDVDLVKELTDKTYKLGRFTKHHKFKLFHPLFCRVLL